MEGMIEITGANLVEAVKAAYDLSQPQGLGFLHAQPGSLTDEEAESLVHPAARYPVSLDYVRGRACKFTVHKRDGRLWINRRWFDHTEEQQAELLQRLGVTDNA